MMREDSQANSAYQRLEEAIVTLQLKPGEAVTETALTEQLGMGRTPVREAIQRLSWEGLVVIRPRLGIVIAEMNPSDFSKVLDARHALEKLVAGTAARLASIEQRAELQTCTDDMTETAKAGDISAFLRLDRVFDEIVCEAACNPFAAKALAPLQTHSRRFWFRHFSQVDLTPAAENHIKVMQAIAEGDEAAALETADTLMTYLKRQAAFLITGEM